MGFKDWAYKKAGIMDVKALPALLEDVSRRTALAVRANAPLVDIKGNEITLYPADSGQRFVTKGYHLNDAVFSIVSKNAAKASQIRLYHAKIKRNERKTLQEYNYLSKQAITPGSLKELARMQKAMTESMEVDSPLSKLLNRPNRNETQSEFIENLFALRELQGEGNIWLPRPMNSEGQRDNSKPPTEMFAIPKPHLLLKGDQRDPWTIAGYVFVLNGQTYDWDKTEVIMWTYNNPMELTTTLEHLRGFAPLTSFMVTLQGMNEADFAVAASNKNRGAYGFAYREDLTAMPSPEQAASMRKQFDDILYNSDMQGKIGLLGGKWGYHNLGASMEDQQLLEQYSVGFKRLCRVFNTPSELFSEGNDTYENRKQYKREWIYDKIAPAMYQVRGLLSDKLLRDFQMDQESNIIDCDVMSLQEMSVDVGQMATGLSTAWWTTPNEKRDAMGYEQLPDPNMDKIYLPSGYSTADQLNEPIGGGLDNDIDLLNEDE